MLLKHSKNVFGLSFILLTSFHALAEEVNLADCIYSSTLNANDEITATEIKRQCQKDVKKALSVPVGLQSRVLTEKESAFNPDIILPHKMNYILPFSYTNNINQEVYLERGPWSDDLKGMEAKFQISLKVPIVTNLVNDGDQLSFGFTLKSWWQLYTVELSRPFRETNYEPEIFYHTPLDWQPGGWNTSITYGFVHQSNGRAQLLSRSWNRFYADMHFAKDNLLVSFKPWFRIPEGDKETTVGESANDNVDIIDYMGNFELTLAYEWDDYAFSLMGRENFKEHHGFIEAGFTFPLTGRLKGYVQYSNGYGESMIDYDHSQQRIGIGFALTDIM